MAEAIAKNLCKNKEINIFSRAIYETDGLDINEKAKIVLKNNNIDFSSHYSKCLTLDEIKNANLILTMGKEHKSFLNKVIISQKSIKEWITDSYEISIDNKIYTLYEYVLNKDLDINDPFGSNLEIYEKCFNEIYSLIEKINFDEI